MRRLGVVVGLAAVLGLTGCGGGDSKEKAAPTTTTLPGPTTVPIGNDQASTPFCQLAKTYTDKFAAVAPSLSDPVKLRAATTDAEAAIRQAQATAPAEIKADVTVVATTVKEALTSLQKNNFDLNKSPDVISKLQDPAFQTAVAHVNTYGHAHCGIA